MFSRLQCLHGSFWYESRGWSWFSSRAWEEACLLTYLSIGPMQIEEENQVFKRIFVRPENQIIAFPAPQMELLYLLKQHSKLSTAGEYGRLII
jgi:hypothetical protein